MNLVKLEDKKIMFARSNSGIPALWERLKEFNSMKRITLIFNPDGTPKKESLFNKLSTSDTLIPIRENDIICKIFFDNEGIGISIIRIKDIDKYSNNAIVEIVRRKPSGDSEWSHNENSDQFTDSEWNNILPVIEKVQNNIQI